MEQILQIFKKVFGENANEVFFNGTRAEGCSLIFVGDVWSYQVEKLINVLNQTMSDKFGRYFGEWRVRKATQGTIVNKEVPKDVLNDCYEVRLIFMNYYRRDSDSESEAPDHPKGNYINPEWD